jgi:hypothetical protein
VIASDQVTNLLLVQESATLDFKRALYDFDGEPDRANANIVKDVCSMVNTVRSNSSYIIFGVDTNAVGKPILVGVTTTIDEAILQDKVKEKIFPRPEFRFYFQEVDGHQIAVMEFPVRRYESPVTATIPMKGVKVGAIYYRQGTANTEATGQEVIRIYEWMKSLPNDSAGNSKQSELQDLLTLLQDYKKSLSPIISSVFRSGKKYQLQNIVSFCELELKGTRENAPENSSDISYRFSTVFLDVGAGTEINLDQFTAAEIRRAIKDGDHMIEAKIHLQKSLQELEMLLDDFNENKGKRIATLTTTTRKIMAEFKGNDSPTKIYIFPEDVLTTIRKIRSKAIELLMSEI